MAISATHALQQEIENAKVIKEQIIAAAGDDPEFIRDGIEGETNLFELIAKMVADDGLDDALISGIKLYESSLKDRRSRIENRKDVRRAIIATALEVAGVKKHETPAGTVSLQNVQPHVIVLEEADIPVEYFTPQPPKLDKKALGEFLKGGGKVSGATLSNGSTTTRITR